MHSLIHTIHLYKTYGHVASVEFRLNTRFLHHSPCLMRMMVNLVSARWKEKKTFIYFSIVTTKENNINILNKDVQSFLISKSYIYINAMESTDTASRRWIICTDNTVSHCGIKCLTLYLDVSLYWVIGLSAIPHVPTPTLPFTLSGDANMLFFTYQNNIYIY